MSNAASGKECLIVGEGGEITGKVDVPGSLEVHGKIVGEVRAGRITVGATGRIEGRMVAKELELHGYASDFLSASRRLAVRATPVPAAPTVRAEDAADDATAEAGS